MSDNSNILLALIVVLCLMILGGNVGLTVYGELNDITLPSTQPGLTGIISWCWNGIQFFLSIMLFQIPGMPPWLTLVFWVILVVLPLITIINWVRGKSGT